MESKETPQDKSTEEQGHVSALAEPKDQERELPTNTAVPNKFTEPEKQLAERYKVEPKLIRMIGEIVAEHTAEICELISVIQGERKQEAKPETENEDESPSDVAESMIKQWLLNQNYKTKLAFTILYGYHFGDHGTEKLANEISNQYEAEIMAMAKKPDISLSSVEVYMTGVVAELLVWQKNN